MNFTLRMFVAGLLQICCLAAAAEAQYIYLDSNGDGVNTVEDRMNPNGAPTMVDVYIITNRNRDGSTAVCNTGSEPLTMNQYQINLLAVGGTVTYSGFTNRQAAVMPTSFGELNPDGIRYKNGFGGGTQLAPGTYRVCTLTITAWTGTPRIDIVDQVQGSVDLTGFGTACLGRAFDNVYRLDGPNVPPTTGDFGDFLDWAGIGVRDGANTLPWLNVPGNVAGKEGHWVTISATSTDPDAGDILTITQTGAPAFLTLSHTPSISPATATLRGVAGFADVGNYTIQWTLTDGAGYQFRVYTQLSISETDRAPSLAPIGDVYLSEGGTATILVSAVDPDGTGITVSAALPPFALLGPPITGTGSINTSVSLSPDFASAGDYAAQVIASAGCTAAVGTFSIHVTNVDRPPAVSPIDDVSLGVDTMIVVPVTVTDPDGDSIALSGVLPAFASFGSPSSGVGAFQTSVSISPSEPDIGSHPATLSAISGALSAVETFTITVVSPNRGPTMTAPSVATVLEGQAIEFNVTAADPDGDTGATISASGIPFGATLSDQGNDTAGFSWTPSFTQAAAYAVCFQGRDAHGAVDSVTTTIEVANSNRSPLVSPGGPYAGITGAPTAFDGSGSSDPDGEPLTLFWSFGDGGSGTGVSPSHVYALPGEYAIELRAEDGASAATEMSTATIQATLSAQAFLKSGGSVLRLGAAGATACAQVEPGAGSFNSTEIEPASVVMISQGTGSIDRVAAVTGKTSVQSDRNGNGVDETSVCFAMDDIRALFSTLPFGATAVDLTIEGSVLGRGAFIAPLTLDVVTGEADGSPSLAPNPMNPAGILSFSTSKPGRIRALMFDAQGRLVRTLLDDQLRPAGHQYLRVDGRNDQGEALSSGVYLYRIETADRVETGRLTIMK